MAISNDQLGQDETIVASMRTHAKVLFWPIIILILLAAALGLGIAFFPPAWQPWANYALIALFVILVVWLVLAPVLRWSSSTYTITDRRIITRKGVLNRTGHDLPLRRINNVNYERSITDRMLGCGTLIFETAAGQPLTLPDVPHVEQVHVTVTELLFAVHDDNGE